MTQKNALIFNKFQVARVLGLYLQWNLPVVLLKFIFIRTNRYFFNVSGIIGTTLLIALASFMELSLRKI